MQRIRTKRVNLLWDLRVRACMTSRLLEPIYQAPNADLFIAPNYHCNIVFQIIDIDFGPKRKWQNAYVHVH